MADLDQIRQFLAAEGILMSFNGPFRHSIIEELGKAVRRHLEAEAVHKSAMADVFTVFIEAAQNVANYTAQGHGAAPGGSQADNGVLVIGRRGDHYLVRCGNFIRREDASPLLAKLDALGGLGPAELKALFKERMRAEVPAGATGAGLGLIRMARTASAPLSYSVVTVEPGLDFFSLTVTL
ncbi:SiaB family protein kinase [Mesoterricola silvestris]|uniref:Uncharacterized protein n=1 Tax=Mesoterricola silvestris TaxID=2927979 RepID=A0AA48GU20_9BACT|nr:SiaB family protein kinase [Mesoterricola silvestris]BDU74370.1 hypothetical protein METEAL_35440 [Mesoterricola silvestris]